MLCANLFGNPSLFRQLKMAELFSTQEQVAIPVVLSTPRFNTFLAARNSDVLKALQLYHWNAQISAAFLYPLHVFEICIRNAVANAAESFYQTDEWPWSTAFETSLFTTQTTRYFSPRRELISTRDWQSRPQQTTGKVIAELKFAFWVSMYTGRHDGRLWNPYLRREYPNIPSNLSISAARDKIHRTADKVRDLRNRIAHHEPIFSRDLKTEYDEIAEIVGYRCLHTAAWMKRTQDISWLLELLPE
jgi:Abi-like protein